MTNRIYDSANAPTTPGATLILSDDGNTIIDLEVKNLTGIAVQVSGKQHLLIGSNGSIISEAATGIQFSGGGESTVTNLGTISAAKAIEIASSGATDRLELYNSGTIAASTTAIVGGKGDDIVINAGIIGPTNGTSPTSLMDLGDGNDFYDGVKGLATGGLIALGIGNDTAYGGPVQRHFSAALESTISMVEKVTTRSITRMRPLASPSTWEGPPASGMGTRTRSSTSRT